MDKNQIYLGIDFGTSNIKVAKWNFKKNCPESVKLDKSQNSADARIKNVIHYVNDSDILWGDAACRKIDEPSTIANVKKKLELAQWSKFVPNIGKERNCVEVIADTLKEIKRAVETQSGNSKIVEKIMLTVPVHFSEIQKEKICQAVIAAGMQPLEVLIEPVSAAIAYSMLDDNSEDEKNVLIFDFGGGTLDFTLFKKSIENDKSKIEVLNSLNLRFGGTDIDKLILDRLVLPKWGIDLNNIDQQEREKVEAILLQNVENAKENLFIEDGEITANITEANIFGGNNIDIEITKNEIHQLFNDEKIYARIKERLTLLLEEIDMLKEDVETVELVGGSSRIKYFQDILTDFFGRKDILHFDESEIYTSVSFGACKYLVGLLDNSLKVDIQNKVAFELGFKENDQFKTIIQKNSLYEFFSPIRSLGVTNNYQVLNKEMYQRHNGSDDIYIGDLVIDTSKYQGDICYRLGTNRHGEIMCRLFEHPELGAFKEELKPQIRV